jgi:hypothetical protein
MEIVSNAKLFFPVDSPSQFYKDVLELGELAKLGERLLSHLMHTFLCIVLPEMPYHLA